MKKNIKDLIILSSLTLILFFILTNYTLVINSIKEVTNLWLFKLFPSLFPFLVIGSILINYNFAYYIKKIFKLKNKTIIMLLALLSGFPSNAKYTKDMYLQKQINQKEANNILGFSFFANPLFLLSVLSLTFSKKITFRIIISHYLANFILAFFYPDEKNNLTIAKNTKSLPEVIALSIKDCLNTMLLILGTITFYNIFICLVKNFLKNNFIITLLTGLLEFSQGLNALSTLNNSIILKAYLALLFISFGSLSILTQIKSIINDTDLNFKKFIKFRFLHILISFILLTISFII